MLEKNIKSLSIKNPQLAQKLLNYSAVGIEFDVTASGDYNLIYNGIPLHDLNDPQLEAKLIFGEDDKSERTLQLIFGMGLGYLFKRAYISSASAIVVFEPSIDVLSSTLGVVDFSSEIADSRVFIINEISELGPLFYKYLFENVKIINLTSYRLIFPDLFDQVFYELNRHYVDQKTNITKSLQISECFVRNLPSVVKCPTIDVLKDKFKNKAALVVSAGPSLDKTIDVIKANRNKFILITIGQAVEALHRADIMPDIVVMLEIYPIRFQINCLGEKKKEINLVLQPSTSIDLYNEETASTFVYLPDHDFMSDWYAKRANTVSFPKAGTVSISALYLAMILGANPIALVGQDLAYTDGKAYASNSCFGDIKLDISGEGQVQSYLNEANLDNTTTEYLEDDIMKKNIMISYYKSFENVVKVKGQNGEDLYTRNSYACFISVYKEIADELKKNNSNITIINCSEGGAYLEGFEHKPLREVVNDLEYLDFKPDEVIRSMYTSNMPGKDKINQLNIAFETLIKDLAGLKEASQRLLKISGRLKNELKLTNTITNNAIDLVKKIQKVDLEIRNYNQGYRVAFIYPFIQKELFEYNRLKDKVASSEKEQLVNTVNAMGAFAETMIVAVDRVLASFEKLEGFPFKE